jgi:hypothetical protein
MLASFHVFGCRISRAHRSRIGHLRERLHYYEGPYSAAGQAPRVQERVRLEKWQSCAAAGPRIGLRGQRPGGFLPFDRFDKPQTSGTGPVATAHPKPLITNAVEAMSGVPEGTPEVRISTSQTNTGDILAAVQDSGPALDARNPDRVFDPFYSTKARGLGIGLCICPSIIEAHEGRLWTSRSEPHGATFLFTLPVRSTGACPEEDRIEA